MSFSDLLGRLTEPVRSLVKTVSSNTGSSIFGTSEKDTVEVKTWIEKLSTEELDIKSLDLHLVSRTFLVSNYLTVADIALFGALHSSVSKQKPEEHLSHPSVTRYFDHIQTRPQVRSMADRLRPHFPLILLDVENAPKPKPRAEPLKKKEKVPKAAAETTAAVPEVNDTVLANQASDNRKPGKAKKELKERKKEGMEASEKKTTKSASIPTASEPTMPQPSMIDLRVGRIVDVRKHPDADGLYVEQIDIGEETGPRTVVSGLVNYIPIEQMRDKRLIVVCNLKPASMRGVKSFAMVLCATHKDGKESGIEIVDPPKDSKPGDRVYFEGQYEDDKPLDQLNPKKKIFETIQPGFTTLESREAAWIDPVTNSVHRLRTHGGPDGVCKAPSFVGASLS